MGFAVSTAPTDELRKRYCRYKCYVHCTLYYIYIYIYIREEAKQACTSCPGLGQQMAVLCTTSGGFVGSAGSRTLVLFHVVGISSPSVPMWLDRQVPRGWWPVSPVGCLVTILC
ncbi:hypothetical protein LZ30DRAFT_144638 [Colletotrichum cereale]|nr:hypothetical protein LZ30DRAFT_144638 [Colletotrichum cereale]